jgi:histidine triad (HIT) family protein
LRRMASVFSKIISGDLPGRFVYSDDEVVAFLTIAPLRPGHTLVVPRREVANWLELSESELQALWSACRVVGRAIDEAFSPGRVAALLLGLEVPHVHVHLVPIDSEAEVHFDRADSDPDPAVLDDAQERIRAALENPAA